MSVNRQICSRRSGSPLFLSPLREVRRKSYCTDLRRIHKLATPSSVKAYGEVRLPPRPFFALADCNSKESLSSFVIWNMKSAGKRATFRFTAIQIARGDLVEIGQVGIDHDVLIAYAIDAAFNVVKRQDARFVLDRGGPVNGSVMWNSSQRHWSANVDLRFHHVNQENSDE